MIAAHWERLRSRPSYRSEILEARCPNTLRGIDDLKRAKAADPRLRAALHDS